jgi:DNA-3-methyladenine glycosylase II
MTLGPAERHLVDNCAVMAALVERHGRCVLLDRVFDPFRTLAGSIIGQQLSVKAADTIERRVLAAIGGALEPGAILAVEPEALRACGLSNAKVRYLRALSEKTIAGEMDFVALATEPDEQAVMKTLTALPGVGAWTAEMFLIFGLQRPDVASHGDAGLQRAVRLLFGPDKTLADVSEPWRPYRSIASWYLWRHLDAAPIDP